MPTKYSSSPAAKVETLSTLYWTFYNGELPSTPINFLYTLDLDHYALYSEILKSSINSEDELIEVPHNRNRKMVQVVTTCTLPEELVDFLDGFIVTGLNSPYANPELDSTGCRIHPQFLTISQNYAYSSSFFVPPLSKNVTVIKNRFLENTSFTSKKEAVAKSTANVLVHSFAQFCTSAKEQLDRHHQSIVKGIYNESTDAKPEIQELKTQLNDLNLQIEKIEKELEQIATERAAMNLQQAGLPHSLLQAIHQSMNLDQN